jgi:hypothetical protein
VRRATNRTASTASATRSGRRRYALAMGSDGFESRERDTWPESANRGAAGDQSDREQRLAALRRALAAPAWTAARAAQGQEGGGR